MRIMSIERKRSLMPDGLPDVSRFKESILPQANEVARKNAVDPTSHADVQADARSLGNSETPPVADHGRFRILAVDDDPLHLHMLESMLFLAGYDVVTATSGAEALAVLDTREWDLVIADVVMPHMSGYELTKRIRTRYDLSELPILLLTARSRSEDFENGFRAGANDYMTKPTDPRELRARVRALTRLKQSARERLRMEAAWLQAQIEPHFFFNTLNSIAALHYMDPDQMMELIAHFGNFLRMKYKFQHAAALVPLEDELQLVRSYLHIEKARYGDRLQIHWDVGHPGNWKIPPYTLQPLVENAIKHGVMKRLEGGGVWIKLVAREGCAELSVTDDGMGMPEEMLRQLRNPPCSFNAIALRNVDFRLKRRFGTGLRIESQWGQGTTVSFVIKT